MTESFVDLLIKRGLSQEEAQKCSADLAIIIFGVIADKLAHRLSQSDKEKLQELLASGKGEEFYDLLRATCSEAEWDELFQKVVTPLIDSYMAEVING